METRKKALERFSDQAFAMVEEYTANKGKPAPSPYFEPYKAFKRKAYALIRRTRLEQGGGQLIKGIVRRYDVEPAHLHYKGNEFHFGLLAIDPEDEVLDARKRSLLARQLTYAHLHDVPPKYLVGFLWQSGPTAEIPRKLKRKIGDVGD